MTRASDDALGKIHEDYTKYIQALVDGATSENRMTASEMKEVREFLRDNHIDSTPTKGSATSNIAKAIQAAVEADPSLEPAVRAAAVRIARLIEDSPGRLSRRASDLLYKDNRSPADYEQAKKAAASAFESGPASNYFASTLAKAWTRLLQPDKAIEVWRAHVDSRRATSPADD